ncbi:predicted membrane protein [Brachybacterium faecium DSM 4810]|uniref:Predicted membrane protein n=1 Tax=Brachybacterium faecium (strain ATCC 43885 / DSM 4810 / JCM 11609 / LMG 19847 / NBRC 14762 / NCIMB 9860 / 6-10) TaxID=446465 RepID=C7MGQ2_BRAFD|nr:DUF2306 domain-containing protein [Brachybacterium faecium]ACU84243.1 predicted membrane protein [Brachybacterium faecium DSM 4810]HJG52079.1 DUF2306 domain-containing protein [Brachybacterium faecium]
METIPPVIVVHALAAGYVLLLGPLQILRRRRDLAHRLLGITWVAAMLAVCVSSFWIRPDGFSWLHGLSTWTLVCMVVAIGAIRAGHVALHRGFMIGSYLGTLAAFAFAAFVPTGLIPQLLRSEPLVMTATALGVAGVVLVAHLVAVRAAARRPVPSLRRAGS